MNTGWQFFMVTQFSLDERKTMGLQTQNNNNTIMGHIITHNHWDREWVLTDNVTKEQARTFFTNLFLEIPFFSR